MADSQIRQTAYKVWISDLINGEFVKPEGEWTPSYIQVRDNKVSRANIIANVIMNYKNDESTYVSLTLDDGSDNISLKAWNEDTKILEDIQIGDTILVIARAREYNGATYLVPEIVRKLDKPEWIKLRKLELTKIYGEREENSEKPIQETKEENTVPKIEEEELVTDDPGNGADRQKILDIIAKIDTGDGAETTEIVSKVGIGEGETNKLIQDLLKEGEIFEIKAGRLKLIE
ncbi:hypothetical protein HN706_02345 [Candidatus Woesearchaeota archaeon]|jgi:RPA family protein|nr:hypothetical protein [Candidatus Woesearchaeota archaeon]MBT6735433.1 hypothetical protein [Candidatus Woesearchaeota archaeon]MBT7169446.1 hypothetical protein [Candidatus Woesearchaeota archaeon]MBT7474759.1 hypothetical protein [Candidatus Woesearchaeota archaeon]